MTNWICSRCGEPISLGRCTGDDLCIGCLKEEGEELDLQEEEEDQEDDHYSFWRGCPMGRLWDPGWGPFGRGRHHR